MPSWHPPHETEPPPTETIAQGKRRKLCQMLSANLRKDVEVSAADVAGATSYLWSHKSSFQNLDTTPSQPTSVCVKVISKSNTYRFLLAEHVIWQIRKTDYCNACNSNNSPTNQLQSKHSSQLPVSIALCIWSCRRSQQVDEGPSIPCPRNGWRCCLLGYHRSEIKEYNMNRIYV